MKVNIAEVLRAQLARPSWQPEMVAIGAATDPYQPAEGRYRLTRACIQALGEADNPLTIITRGPMIVRDVDVLAEAARRASVSVTFSIPTLDEDVWRKTEPWTAHPRQSLRALKQLVDAGIKAASGWRRSCRASPTGPSSSRRSSGPPARPARRGSGPMSLPAPGNA